jgi:hypothetical protein
MRSLERSRHEVGEEVRGGAKLQIRSTSQGSGPGDGQRGSAGGAVSAVPVVQELTGMRSVSRGLLFKGWFEDWGGSPAKSPGRSLPNGLGRSLVGSRGKRLGDEVPGNRVETRRENRGESRPGNPGRSLPEIGGRNLPESVGTSLPDDAGKDVPGNTEKAVESSR